MLPKILRVSMMIVIISPQDAKNKVSSQFNDCRIDSFVSDLPREINFSDDKLHLLFTPGHYDALYCFRSDKSEEHDYDNEFVALYSQVRAVL